MHHGSLFHLQAEFPLVPSAIVFCGMAVIVVRKIPCVWYTTRIISFICAIHILTYLAFFRAANEEFTKPQW